MDISVYIKEARNNANMTQKQLADAIGKTVSTVQKYELGLAMPPLDVLNKIAVLLDINILTLIEPTRGTKGAFWSADLEDKLKQVGFSTSADEDNAALWINYPDGALEVTEEDLKELHASTNEYICFKLEELKKKRLQDFRPKRGGQK